MATLSFFTTSDNRRIAYAQYGDMRGIPILYFHGWPASHISAEIYTPIANTLGVRIIAPDRPGFGRSDFQPNRSILDWAGDMTALCDSLDIQTFSVWGNSGGAPYAAVCAYALKPRVKKLGISVGAAPLDGYDYGKKLKYITLATILIRKQSILRKLVVYIQYLNSRYGLSVKSYAPLWSDSDRDLYQNPMFLRRGVATLAEAFRQGYQGPEYEWKLMGENWGFLLSDIHVPTYLWYGGDDHPLVVAMGKRYAKEIKKSKLHLYAGEGHLTSVTHATEILDALK